MSAIMHCIVVGIENDRISNVLRIWRWRKDVEGNRRNLISSLNKSLIIRKWHSEFFVVRSYSIELKNAMHAFTEVIVYAFNTLDVDDFLEVFLNTITAL